MSNDDFALVGLEAAFTVMSTPLIMRYIALLVVRSYRLRTVDVSMR